MEGPLRILSVVLSSFRISAELILEIPSCVSIAQQRAQLERFFRLHAVEPPHGRDVAGDDDLRLEQPDAVHDHHQQQCADRGDRPGAAGSAPGLA